MDKAELLNSFFTKQSTIDDSAESLPPPQTPQNPLLSNICILPKDVTDAIALVNPSKASGPDPISPRLLREGSEELYIPLATYFNKLLNNAYFPSPWKLANVTPIFKKSDPSDPQNYRPISLLSCIGKLMERCIHKYLYNYVIDNNKLTSYQSGFIKGDSTVNQLTYLYNDICKALDEGKEVRAVFCDISKAFDRVWHRGLLYKLSSMGIQGSLLEWFSSYLSTRRQRVVYSNSSSQWTSINAGVPQGSILGPLLFLIYINDIVNNIHSNIRLFADDTSLYIIVEDPISASTILNNDLETIHQWSEKWLVKFNPSKTETMLFSRKLNKPQYPDIIMNGQIINTFKEHKHLGLTLSDDGKWNSHISSYINKAWQRIGLIRSLKYILNRACLERMYFTTIRPLLEYADVVWNNCTNELKAQLESVQIEAARIVCGATKLCNIEKLYLDLKWETLEIRRNKHKLILFYKMKNNLTPQYLSDLIPEQTQVRYNLRNASDVPSLSCRTQLYTNSFLPSTIRDWNRLDDHTRSAPTVTSFKSRIKKNNSKASPLYNVGSRKSQILHTRLRLSCSALNHDLHRRSIVESPNCQCGSVETVNHFLLYCDIYQLHRQRYLTNLPCAPIANKLLYGDERLTFDENKHIFIQVQKFILATKRF